MTPCHYRGQTIYGVQSVYCLQLFAVVFSCTHTHGLCKHLNCDSKLNRCIDMSVKVPFFPVLQVAPLSGSLNGDLLMSSGSIDLPPKPLVRGSMSVAQADYPERPEVIVRRETGSSTLPLKTEVPLHLFSTTNQLHKPVGVQQQIPTKLAAINSSKGKGSKSGKASHRTDSTGEAPRS